MSGVVYNRLAKKIFLVVFFNWRYLSVADGFHLRAGIEGCRFLIFGK